MIKNKKGFTLVELLVVVLIVAILAAVGLPQYFRIVERQKGVEALAILSAIGHAQERFFLINNVYTTDYTVLEVDFTDFETNQPPTGTTFTARYFTYTITGTTDANGLVIAERRDNTYSFERIYETGVVCCRPGVNSEMCELFDVAVC